MDTTNSNCDHYYAVGYSVDDDPYVYENGVLINNFNIQNTHDLNDVEQKFTIITTQKLLKDRYFHHPIDMTYYTSIHRSIFSEVYPWAGEIRQVDICKGDTVFETHSKIATELQAIFDDLNKNLSEMRKQGFDEVSTAIAKILGQLNQIHPFREGNGRTQRVFIHNLLDHLGFEMDWSTVSSNSMTQACIEFKEGNINPMRKLIRLNLKVKENKVVHLLADDPVVRLFSG